MYLYKKSSASLFTCNSVSVRLSSPSQYGEIGIDQKLVAAQRGGGNETIMMLNNGCLCCTVRGDLVEFFKT